MSIYDVSSDVRPFLDAVQALGAEERTTPPHDPAIARLDHALRALRAADAALEGAEARVEDLRVELEHARISYAEARAALDEALYVVVDAGGPWAVRVA